MSSMRIAARFTTKCPCGTRFEQDPAVIFQGKKDLYCCEACIVEYAPEYVCQACGDANDPEKAAYGLPVCAACQRLAWWSCWRKRIFQSSFEAGRWARIFEATGTRPLTPYRCPLCTRWHASSWSVYEVAGAEFKARIDTIAAVFRRAKFDIDQARGYTNNPDGTHEIDEGYDANADLAEAERILKRAVSR